MKRQDADRVQQDVQTMRPPHVTENSLKPKKYHVEKKKLWSAKKGNFGGFIESDWRYTKTKLNTSPNAEWSEVSHRDVWKIFYMDASELWMITEGDDIMV